VRQIMRYQGLVACQPRPFRLTTEADAEAAAGMPDLVKRDFTADRPGLKFVGDITYSAQSTIMCSPVGGPRPTW
jgi:putative transposase